MANASKKAAKTVNGSENAERAERLDISNIQDVYAALAPLSEQRVRAIIKSGRIEVSAIEVLRGHFVNVVQPEAIEEYRARVASGEYETRQNRAIAFTVWLPMDADASTDEERVPDATALAWLQASGYKFKLRDTSKSAAEDAAEDANEDAAEDASAADAATASS